VRLVVPILVLIMAILVLLWWRPMWRWSLGTDELERRIEALEHRITQCVHTNIKAQGGGHDRLTSITPL